MMSIQSSESHSPEAGVEIIEDIWMEILARVPMVLVVKLRCLSKFHRNLINSPCFIQKHSDQSHRTETPTYFITPSTNPPSRSRCIDRGLLKDYVVKKFDPTNNFDPTVVQRLNPPHGNKTYKCVGSCKGILLLRSPENIMLWNPLTGGSRIFPKDRRPYKSVNYFLGHDQTTDDLKIVKMMHKMKMIHRRLYLDPIQSGTCDSEIYSSKSGSWRGKIIEADHSLQLANHVGVFVEGTNSLHMIGEGEEEGVFIVAFDFSTEKFNRIQPPCRMDMGKTGIWSLEGCLSVYARKTSRVYKTSSLEFGVYKTSRVWVMKEYGNPESWVQVLQFDYSECMLYRNLMPLQFMNGGRQCLFLSDQGVLFCDFEKKGKEKLVSLEKTDRSKFRFWPLGFEYTPSLRPI